MGVKDIVKYLSHDQREMLIAHVQNPVPIDFVPCSPENRNNAARTRSALFSENLISYRPSGAARPTHSVLTELGREVVCGVLAEYAEALIAASIVDSSVASLVPEPSELGRRIEAALIVP